MTHRRLKRFWEGRAKRTRLWLGFCLTLFIGAGALFFLHDFFLTGDFQPRWLIRITTPDDWQTGQARALSEAEMRAYPNTEALTPLFADGNDQEPPLPHTVEDYGDGDPESAKLIVIGLDGATWKILTPLLNEGLMPNLERLLARSSYGWMATDVACSPISWTSIASGKIVEKSMVVKDLEILKRNAWEFDYRVVRVSRLWDILAFPQGRRMALIQYYFMPPAKKYPSASIYDQSDREIKNIASLVEKLLKSNKVDQIFSIEKETDDLQHSVFFFTLMKYLSQTRRFSRADSRAAKQYAIKAKKLVALYRKYDRLFGYLLEKHSKDYIFIVSDHGFHADPPIIRIDPVEELHGAFNLIPASDLESQTWLFGSIPFDLRIRHEGWAVKLFVDEKTQESVDLQIHFSEYHFKAQQGLLPNSAGLLADHLQKIIKKEKAPFLVVREGSEVSIMASKNFPAYAVELHSYEFNNHNFKDPGILIMAGPGLAKGKLLKGATLFDVTPTILYLKGLAVGEDMSGRVLEQGIDPSLLSLRPIQKISSYDDPDAEFPARPPRIKLTPEEYERLRSLGYI